MEIFTSTETKVTKESKKLGLPKQMEKLATIKFDHSNIIITA